MAGNRCLLVLAAAACGFLLSGCADVPGMAGYTGRVVNASGGPISGAQVRVVPLQIPGREVSQAMVAQALGVLALSQPEQAEEQIQRLKIPWARAGAWMTAAGLTGDPTGDTSLRAWRKATEAAAACRDPEHGVSMIGWALSIAALPGGEFPDSVGESGLLWLIP